jgi:long-chain acyl-CoA synthetase
MGRLGKRENARRLGRSPVSAELSSPTEAAGPDDKPWLTHYPPGVPHQIVDRIGTIADLFHESVSRYPQRPAVESFGHRITYEELAKASAHVAAWLQARGVTKGDRVAIMLPNVMAYPAILFGTLLAGATVVNVNPLYTPRELVQQLKDAGARTLFVLENFAHTVEQAGPDLALEAVVVVAPGDLLGFKGAIVNLVSRYVKRAVPRYRVPGSISFSAVLAEGRKGTFAPVEIGPEDVAFLQYTGGTTGVAKGATLTHRNVAANVIQSELWMRPSLGDRQHIMVTALPLYHIFALTACCLVMARLGGCQLLVANPRDIPGFVKLLKSRPFTCISGVNTLYNALARAPGIEKVDFSKLVFCVAGGMATQASVAAAWKKLTGRPIVEGYGLSETSPVVAVNRLDIEAFTGTIGYPVPSTEISIRSAEGQVQPAGTPGELCVRGPQVMRGYWGRPDETARAMTPDGFFRTGDVAVLLEDGSIRIVDRLKDMIIVSGFNVYPNEVEDVIAANPGVAEVAVVGAPHEKTGELVEAHVVRSDPGLTEASLKAWCRERLTPYKIPHRIVFAKTLPKTNVGKVLRRALRDENAQP